MTSTTDRLSKLLCAKAVIGGPDAISAYFRNPVETNALCAALPEKTEDVQQIMKISREDNIPVFTTYDTCFPECVASFKKGILLDFKRMNKIEKIDAKNLMVHVQRGGTLSTSALYMRLWNRVTYIDIVRMFFHKNQLTAIISF